MLRSTSIFFFFFFNDTATTEIYTLSLHDALPILYGAGFGVGFAALILAHEMGHYIDIRRRGLPAEDRKSTRLNSSHGYISYAVFCLKKKNKHKSSLPWSDPPYLMMPRLTRLRTTT